MPQLDFDLVRLAKQYFNLELPTTMVELKSAYRREAQKLHPDKGGSREGFQRMDEAYKVLSNPKLAYIIRSSAEEASPTTVDGILLTELGVGVAQGATCETCDGKGYTSIQAPNFISCDGCRGVGWTATCNHCRGTGRHTWGGKCYRCNGTGTLGVQTMTGGFGNRPFKRCDRCMGRGGYKTTKVTYHHYKCGDCDGKGARPMFNPLWAAFRMSK